MTSKTHSKKNKKALFLDRDGVINHDYGYVHKAKDFKFIDGIFELLSYASSKNFLIIVITNQAGIGRGFYSEKDFHILSNWMNQEFHKKKILIDKIYFSSTHPTEGLGPYKKDDYRRKPNPGMIFEASNEMGIDLSKSVLIGDKYTDIEAGNAAKIGTNILFQNSNFIPPNKNSFKYELICNLALAKNFL
tara:strand:- start:1066 stop:1635 length:570 start_codon:yes stop_codon:yes gene_type:complete